MTGNAGAVAFKVLGIVAYIVAAFAGIPLLLVGTGMLVTSWLGSSWWAGLILAPICLTEFIGGLSFFLWDDNPIREWLTN